MMAAATARFVVLKNWAVSGPCVAAAKTVGATGARVSISRMVSSLITTGALVLELSVTGTTVEEEYPGEELEEVGSLDTMSTTVADVEYAAAEEGREDIGMLVGR